MKKIILSLFLFIGILWGQLDLNKYNGESLSYDIVWKGMKVGKAEISIGFVENDSTRMKVTGCIKTIGWVKYIFNELDSIYTEFNSSSGQLIYAHRFSSWSFLGGDPKIDTTTITKVGQLMTYSFKKIGESEQDKPWKQSVIVDDNFSAVDLQDIVASIMIVRASANEFDKCYYINILGKTGNNLVPKIYPIQAKNKEIIEIDNILYNAVTYQIDSIENNDIFRDSTRVIIWVTDDDYRLPLQTIVTVTVPVFGKESVRVTLNIHESIIPYRQSNKLSSR